MCIVERNKQEVCLMPVGVFLVAHIRTDRAEWQNDTCSQNCYCCCVRDNKTNWQTRQSHVQLEILLETEIHVESTLNIYHQHKGRTTRLWLALVRNSIISFKTIVMYLLCLGVSPCSYSCTVAKWNADLMFNRACLKCWKMRCREQGGYNLGLSVLECDNTHSPCC